MMRWLAMMGKDFALCNRRAGARISDIKSTSRYDYGAILGGSLQFYAAQRSGVLPSDNPVPWRGDSALGDVAPTGASLTGGYYDDGGARSLTSSNTSSMWLCGAFRPELRSLSGLAIWPQ